MRKKTCYVLLVIAFCIFAGSAVYIQAAKNSISRSETPENAMEKNEFITALYTGDDQIHELHPSSARQLEDGSDLIAIVSCEDWGALDAMCTRRKCTVRQVLKGTCAGSIYIYEPVELIGSGTWISDNGYIPMIPGNDYLLFLKHAAGYGTVNDMRIKNGWYPVDQRYAKYSVSDSDVILLEDGESIPFKDLLKYAWAADDESKKEKYLFFHQALIHQYLH